MTAAVIRWQVDVKLLRNTRMSVYYCNADGKYQSKTLYITAMRNTKTQYLHIIVLRVQNIIVQNLQTTHTTIFPISMTSPPVHFIQPSHPGVPRIIPLEGGGGPDADPEVTCNLCLILKTVL
jgi:hypothetical protein